MSVREQIKAQSITALKARDKETRTRLSGVLALFLEQEKSKGFDGWTEESERALVASHAKKLSSALADLGERPLADEYRAEIALLQPYLPQLLSEAETRALVEPLVEQCRGLGQLMGMVMRSHKGKVDARLVREIAQSLGLK